MYKVKTGKEGKIERYKARLVAQGYNQKYGSDYDETFCPVMRQESLRTLVALSAQFGLELHHVDVATAFLNGTMEEEVYMSQPKGYEKEGEEHLVCKLKNSIYGLKQCPKCWNMALDSQLKNGLYPVEIGCLHLHFRRRRSFLHWGICGRHGPGWTQDQNWKGQEGIEVRHQGPGRAELLSGNIGSPESGGDLDETAGVH